MAQFAVMAAAPRRICLALLLVSLFSAREGAQAQVAPNNFAGDAPSELTKPVIDALGRLPRQQGVAALSAALNAGLPDDLADAALAALGAQGGDIATALLVEFTHHRRPHARVVAYEALARAAGRAATEALAAGLGDREAQVRERCAKLLTALGDARAASRLLDALDHGVAGAAEAFATVAPPENLHALDVRLQSLPLPALLEAYGVVLRRSDVVLEAKLALVEDLKKQGTPAVRSFLTKLVADPHLQSHAALRTALVRAIARMPQSLKSSSP